MRVLSKEYQEHLKKNEIYQFIVNHPKPDFKELEKIEDTYEDDMLRKYEEFGFPKSRKSLCRTM